MSIAAEASNVVACRACGELIRWAQVSREPKPVPLNFDPDDTGLFILLRDDRNAFRISDEELMRWEPLRSHGVVPIAETEARRFRDHRTTCSFRFPLYSVEGAIRRELPGDFRDRRERIRQLRLSLDRRPGGFGMPA